MTVIVTVDVPTRFRGFLASCMLEIAPGVYTAPRLTQGVRDRIWSVLEEWHLAYDERGGIVMTWKAPDLPGGQGIRTLGIPPKQLQDRDGIFLAWRPFVPPQVDRTEG